MLASIPQIMVSRYFYRTFSDLGARLYIFRFDNGYGASCAFQRG